MSAKAGQRGGRAGPLQIIVQFVLQAAQGLPAERGETTSDLLHAPNLGFDQSPGLREQ